MVYAAPITVDQKKMTLEAQTTFAHSQHIKTVPQRLKEIGDIFSPVLKEKTNIKTALARISKEVSSTSE